MSFISLPHPDDLAVKLFQRRHLSLSSSICAHPRCNFKSNHYGVFNLLISWIFFNSCTVAVLLISTSISDVMFNDPSFLVLSSFMWSWYTSTLATLLLPSRITTRGIGGPPPYLQCVSKGESSHNSQKIWIINKHLTKKWNNVIHVQFTLWYSLHHIISLTPQITNECNTFRMYTKTKLMCDNAHTMNVACSKLVQVPKHNHYLPTNWTWAWGVWGQIQCSINLNCQWVPLEFGMVLIYHLHYRIQRVLSTTCTIWKISSTIYHWRPTCHASWTSLWWWRADREGEAVQGDSWRMLAHSSTTPLITVGFSLNCLHQITHNQVCDWMRGACATFRP